MACGTYPKDNVVARRYFDHIKDGGPCPPLDVSELVPDKTLNNDQGDITTLLAEILDDINGTEEIVRNRRKAILVKEEIENSSSIIMKIFKVGSEGDGFRMETSDSDIMFSFLDVIVTNPEELHRIDRNRENRTILVMREADCRPGYVALEVVNLAETGIWCVCSFHNVVVPVGSSIFISSDMFRQGMIDYYVTSKKKQLDVVSNGPCLSVKSPTHVDQDFALSFPCLCWPREVDEWIHRTRLYGWPSQTMIDRIVQSRCDLVPIGDKCSEDTLLQWRISFVRAERLLVHSLTHPQFRVYGLLKRFLSQIKGLLEYITGDTDILCSYFIKMVIFWAIEKSPQELWHEQNLLMCFRFCLCILIVWVRAGYCPNYFIQKNNLFLRKIHGENRQKLLHFLMDCSDLKWPGVILSEETIIKRGLKELITQNKRLRQYQDSEKDFDLFELCYDIFSSYRVSQESQLNASLQHLALTKSDVDEFILFYKVANDLFEVADGCFTEYSTSHSNKQKYRALKKSKHLLIPQASMCTSPGLMILATFHYLTGNYSQVIRICAELRSTMKVFLFGDISKRSREHYQRLYCRSTDTLYHKLKYGIYFPLIFNFYTCWLCLPQLILEHKKHPLPLEIPPLPYASFLSFMCFHELGDRRKRDKELINLRALNYDPEQGGHRFWIVHTLLGICYQTVGDNHKAIRSFKDSLRVKPENNPALERIEALSTVR